MTKNETNYTMLPEAEIYKLENLSALLSSVKADFDFYYSH